MREEGDEFRDIEHLFAFGELERDTNDIPLAPNQPYSLLAKLNILHPPSEPPTFDFTINVLFPSSSLLSAYLPPAEPAPPPPFIHLTVIMLGLHFVLLLPPPTRARLIELATRHINLGKMLIKWVICKGPVADIVECKVLP